jgi:peptidyl-prolyl cis-trans isomerase SurA
MKNYFFGLLLSAFISNAFAQGTVVDKIVAQVGDNIILLSDIEAQKQQAKVSGVAVSSNLDCEILEKMMYQQLLVNQAKLDSLVISDENVDAEMENRLRVIENQIGSREKMEEFYGKTVNEIKDEFREVIRERLLAEEMERKITADISVTPKEVEEFFKTVPEDSIPLINAQLSFQQIVDYPEITKDDKKLAYDKLAGILADIKAGKNFSTQARIHSMDPGSAPLGGTIEASRGMMVPQFEAAAFSLKEGEISDIFETNYGYHILKLNSRKGDDYTCQHILIIPEFSSSALELSANRIDSCYNLLKQNQITWDEAVLTYSNDEATKQNKGIITNPYTGEQTWSMEDLNQIDQEIYLLTDAMDKGDISSPNLYTNIFERKQGVRIIRLMNRSEPHKANLNDDYALIKSAAESNKKEKLINEWIASKLTNAYIRIDDSFENCQFKNKWISSY